MTTTLPGPTVGVVGGGQLGRMLGEAAAPLGIEVIVVDPTPDAPASPVVADQIVAEFDDPDALAELAERADFLTYEIELAGTGVLETVSRETGTPVHPKPETLSLIEDKLLQKRRLEDAGVPVPEFRGVDSVAELRTALDELGYPAMLKAREGGYDGRGNVPIESPDDVEASFETIVEAAPASTPENPSGAAMVEGFVDFKRELAVMGVRGDGERDTFPVTETIHREEILRETVSPPRAGPAVRERACEVSLDVLDVMEGRGVFGIELFQGPDDEILLNEIAPRPHNSGHWTIEGALTSQFEQHLRAVVGWPLGATDRRSPTVTANVLGDVDERQDATLRSVNRVLETDGASMHYYGKEAVSRLRKMGHVTQVGDDDADPGELLERTREVRDELTFQPS
ncbi:Phosphoribosylaminoimidazole carboxylase [Halorhabdus sp. SVX81]|uniref:5-(carboxyamino)imidazole ribonucleotide synthase n=1 Tax=Halorhabdus sp. SVX81 TaxID=2978283 RepID=UPI0023DCAF22|nr:5-(carboxyamino)imidazole ribonucleotide synthase [Halorhabdus sp. SVX81]WEL17060.1 Phosphoribosylaminoimidazole carboxylase [Halorhabdus sp. SVX81]